MYQPDRKLVLLGCLVICGWSLAARAAVAQENEADEDAATEALRQKTRAAMADRWSTLRATIRVAGREREVERAEQPIFSFSDATRDTGHLGTVWVWGAKGRPAALLSLNKALAKPVWSFELVALEEGVSVVMHDGWKWSPKSAAGMTPFPAAPRPADSDARRLVQMRNLARQFAVSEEYFDERIELRLLPQPVYRYGDADSGLIDGALFNFAHGTNPEVLAVIECRKDDAQSVWSYGFLPLAGAGVTATLDGKTVWSKESTRESKAQELYSTWLETEGQ